MTDAAPPSPDLVARLVAEQAPHLADLPVRPSADEGSSNWVFRLGDDLAVRLPRSAAYAESIRTETRFLPRIAPGVGVRVPEVVHAGVPSPEFPWDWAVVSWIAGERPNNLTADQQQALAADLGRFVRELHAVDASGVPVGPKTWGYRCGEPVTDETDRWVDQAALALADQFDPAAVREAWCRVRDVPRSTSPPCWVHTDLSAENLLVDADGHLAGVIDFGAMGVGDGSVDLLYAWSLFDAPARQTLRQTTGADDATWARARAFAFAGPGLLTLNEYRATMPERAARLTRMVRAIAAEVGLELERHAGDNGAMEQHRSFGEESADRILEQVDLDDQTREDVRPALAGWFDKWAAEPATEADGGEREPAEDDEA
ncbi:aminoglycoside phosphotransferase family protein [Mariniluteicoccus endophyticus]